MKTNLPPGLLLVCLLGFALAVPAFAQKEPSTGLAGFPLWSVKKSPITGPFIPGLNAALLLSAEQCGKLWAARAETIDSESLRQLGMSVKQNPNATESEREAARKSYEEASKQFKSQVEAILSPDQRALVVNINNLFEEVQTATFANAGKDNLAELKVQALKDFKQRLEGIISKEQWVALSRAADAEAAAEKNSVKK